MTRNARFGFTVVLLAVLMATAPSRITAGESSPSDAAFERLKTLVGTWEGVEKGSKRPTAATYTLTGGGKVLLEVMGGMATRTTSTKVRSS